MNNNKNRGVNNLFIMISLRVIEPWSENHSRFICRQRLARDMEGSKEKSKRNHQISGAGMWRPILFLSDKKKYLAYGQVHHKMISRIVLIIIDFLPDRIYSYRMCREYSISICNIGVYIYRFCKRVIIGILIGA